MKCKLWILLFAIGALPVSAAKKPNVLYILTDQWRAQATGYAGDPNVRTPNLDSLAQAGLNFDTAISVCPVCTPYRAALQTGRFPLSTGMYHNDYGLDPVEYCMAEIFKDAGYHSGKIDPVEVTTQILELLNNPPKGMR